MTGDDRVILVTGASGFVGLHLVEYLKSCGYANIFGTTGSDNPALNAVIGADHVIQLDLTHEESVFSVVQKLQPRWVFHLAALAFVGESFQRALEVMQNNTTLQYCMLEAVRRYSPSARLLSVGSATSYGLLPPQFDSSRITEEFPQYPSNPYAVSKMTQDYLALSYHLAYKTDIVRVRPFNQIGPRQSGDFAIPAFAQQIVRIECGEQSELLVGNLEAVRDFTDVRDAVQAYELLMRNGESGEVYNVGSGEGVSLEAIVRELITLSPADIMVAMDPRRLRPVDVPVFVADNQKLRRLGWSPRISLDQTLADVLEYERKRNV